MFVEICRLPRISDWLKKLTLLPLVSESRWMIVKNAKLWELARKFENSVGITDETLSNPMFVDLLTQIIYFETERWESLRWNRCWSKRCLWTHYWNLEFSWHIYTTIWRTAEWKLKPSYKDCCTVSGCENFRLKSWGIISG